MDSGAFLLKEDRRAAWLLYGTLLAVCFNGYDSGIMSVILADDQFREYYNVDAQRSGIIAIITWPAIGIVQLGLGGHVATVFGRLPAIRIGIWIMIVGVIIQSVPNTYVVLLVGRLLAGLALGIIAIAVNLYVGEVAPTRMRGSFIGTVSQFGYQLGTLISFWSGYGFSFCKEPKQIAWRGANVLQIPIGLLFFAISFWYPESPVSVRYLLPATDLQRWLLEKYPDEPTRALKQLAYVRDGTTEDERVRNEFHELVASFEFQKRYEPGYRGIFKSRALRKRLAYGIYATSLQQIGGIAAVTMFAVVIYKSLGWTAPSEALAINGIQSVLQLFAVLINTFSVDRFGRKPLLIIGFIIQSTAMLILSSLTTHYSNNDNRSAGITEVAMLFIVGLTYVWSNGPIATTYATEIFPQHVRSTAVGLSLLGQTVCLIALTQPWPIIHERYAGKSYWLLFSLNVAALISVIMILPETKGVSLERMDALFGEADAVQAGEQELGTKAYEMDAYTAVKEQESVDKSAAKKKESGVKKADDISATV